MDIGKANSFIHTLLSSLIVEFEGQFNSEGAEKTLCAFSTGGFDENHLYQRLTRQTLYFIFPRVFHLCVIVKSNMTQIINHQLALFSVKSKRIYKPKPNVLLYLDVNTHLYMLKIIINAMC